MSRLNMAKALCVWRHTEVERAILRMCHFKQIFFSLLSFALTAMPEKSTEISHYCETRMYRLVDVLTHHVHGDIHLFPESANTAVWLLSQYCLTHKETGSKIPESISQRRRCYIDTPQRKSHSSPIWLASRCFYPIKTTGWYSWRCIPLRYNSRKVRYIDTNVDIYVRIEASRPYFGWIRAVSWAWPDSGIENFGIVDMRLIVIVVVRTALGSMVMTTSTQDVPDTV